MLLVPDPRLELGLPKERGLESRAPAKFRQSGLAQTVTVWFVWDTTLRRHVATFGPHVYMTSERCKF